MVRTSRAPEGRAPPSGESDKPQTLGEAPSLSRQEDGRAWVGQSPGLWPQPQSPRPHLSPPQTGWSRACRLGPRIKLPIQETQRLALCNTHGPPRRGLRPLPPGRALFTPPGTWGWAPLCPSPPTISRRPARPGLQERRCALPPSLSPAPAACGALARPLPSSRCCPAAEAAGLVGPEREQWMRPQQPERV